MELEPRPRAKRKFNIDQVLSRIRVSVRDFPKAALFELAERGYSSPFHQVIACLLSIRTLDEVSLPAALRLFEKADSPKKLASMDVSQIDEIVRPCTFHYQKAQRVQQISRDVLERFSGKLPCDFESLTSLPGIGPKCANLVLGIACGKAEIGVDVHVHRVTNRWGYVKSADVEGTRAQLEAELPKKYWVEINTLLVPFGKHICRGRLPKCSSCPVLEYCRQVGVERWV